MIELDRTERACHHSSGTEMRWWLSHRPKASCKPQVRKARRKKTRLARAGFACGPGLPRSFWCTTASAFLVGSLGCGPGGVSPAPAASGRRLPDRLEQTADIAPVTGRREQMSYLPPASNKLHTADQGRAMSTVLVASENGSHWPVPPAGANVVASVPPTPASHSPVCPDQMVRIDGYCIDRYEAHLVTIGPDGATTIHPYYQRPEPGQVYVAQSGPGLFPQAYISRKEALAACQQAGKRLCTVSEWYRACVGPHRWPFPYGETEQKGRCNTRKIHLLSQLFGRDPQAWKYEEHFNSPQLNQEPGFLARTGEYAGCVTPEGVFDLVGNLHEWVSDLVDWSLAKKLPLLGSIHDKLGKNAGHGIFMGGFFSTGSEHGRGCAFVTIGHEGKYHDYSTGFRCCKDATL